MDCGGEESKERMTGLQCGAICVSWELPGVSSGE